jgi:IS30 family transposase
MKKYKQLSPEQRYIIGLMVKQGKTQTAIASEVGCSPSTVCRELKRNSIINTDSTIERYDAKEAQKRAELRHKIKPKRVLLDYYQKLYIRSTLMHERYSPELISVTGKALLGRCVSHETIYQWIWRCKRLSGDEDKHLYRFLRHGHRKRKRGNQKRSRGITIKERTPIDQRPEVANQRRRTGDLEVDFMMGKNMKESILVMTDRATLYTRLTKLPNKGAQDVLDAIKAAIRSFPCKVHTLTFDNDMSFARHHELHKEFKVKTYFTRPYTSQDKGTVENRIGVIRRFIHKKTDLRKITYENVQTIESLINNRPVRKFQYLSPYQIAYHPIFCTY